MSVVLVIDDDAALRDGLEETLNDLGHQVETAECGEAGLARLRRGGIDAVLLDLRMPGMDGLEVLRRLREAGDAVPVAVLTAVPTATNTIEAMRLGAADHLTKPIGRAELAQLLDRLIVPAIPSATATPAEGMGEMVGGSAAMREVQKTIGLLADGTSTVLITGETGTGKEVVARAIHGHGNRGRSAFIAVNCAAIPGELLESQLFGHVRGAFTGAIADRRGAFRDADGGTLFLDEVGDMPAAMQAKLLRVLQEREVVPLGGRPVRVNVRVLAATHRDLRREVTAGAFREDLFYRLGVVPLHLPPLRERLADILPLAEHFLAQATGGRKSLAANAASRLLAHPWPGNARELRNAMDRVAALVRGPLVSAAALTFLGESGPAAPEQVDWLSGELPAAVARLEAAMIRRALAASNGNRAEAARRLGIHRQLLHVKLSRLEDLSDERTAERPTSGQELRRPSR